MLVTETLKSKHTNIFLMIALSTMEVFVVLRLKDRINSYGMGSKELGWYRNYL